ncbi:hypothetical protein NQ317_016459 [Molorchus minor]|uniref:Uncharacterized protein n=1 Tax=Molorchus minor TaxID=1323400 RepID=A0ABQ9K0K5_9CUCU|nr:hypothetical protein NQ317_016459 [Molorchus minor]
MKVEEMVFTPFQNTLENEFPNIIKHKHNLRKYCLDKDSASNRYHATRKETLKDDMEEADTKVEQCRDLLAIETFNLLAKENEFSEYVLQLLKLQRGYHESALKNLETIIPQLEKKIGNSSVRKVFGTPLKEHLRITGKKVAYPLEICISALSEYGMLEEGLFRITASATKVKRLKSAVDSGCFSYLIPEYRDAHVLASLLKTYLRELPEPLLMFHLHKEWIEAMHSQENQMEIVKSIIQKLPQENKDNLSYLFHFLHKCTQHSENKMSPSNLAIVFSPNLLWTENEKENVNIGNCVVINMLIELFIKNAKSLFPDDVSKYVTVTQLLPEEQTSSIYKISPDSLDVKSSSPKPNIRKKKYAPIPPHNERIATDWKSSNLERKNKNAQNAFNLSIDSLNCEQNIVIQEAEKNSKHVDLLESIDDKPKNINQPVNKTYKTVASHVICSPNDTKTEKSSPSSNAPKVLNTAGNNTSVKKNETTIRPPKPEVPARPLSLTKNSPSEIKKTHCSVYSVADKLHPSIINIEEPKHDICKPKLQEAEKYEPKKESRNKNR